MEFALLITTFKIVWSENPETKNLNSCLCEILSVHMIGMGLEVKGRGCHGLKTNNAERHRTSDIVCIFVLVLLYSEAILLGTLLLKGLAFSPATSDRQEKLCCVVAAP